MTERTDVLVIGAGVIGVACALELARRGTSVAVVDRGPTGHGCSYGNAGWLTPSLATPLPAPGMLFTSLRYLLDSESPLRIQPSASPALARWLFRFLRSTSRRQFERSTAALMEVSKYSLEAYDSLSRELPEPFGFTRRGLLMIGLTGPGVAACREEQHLAARHGIPGTLLDPAGVRALEPAVTGAVAGGVHFTSDGHLEPLEVVEAMAREAARLGVRFRSDVDVFDLSVTSGRVDAALTTRGPIRADRYVLAAGAWSKELARRLGLRLPILGGKGYAVTVETPPRIPLVPIKVVEKRIAITPREGSLRLAGTLELVDGDLSISPRRVDAIVRGSREILTLPDPLPVGEVWRGLRPCTPDGMPVIGFPRAYPNLLVATGHQMLGLHTAPGTARLAADLLLGTPPTFDPTPFRFDRF
jgi:D-amino-acid dehydrogenase